MNTVHDLRTIRIVYDFIFKVTQTNPIQALSNHLKPTVSIPDVLLLKSGDDVSIPCNTTSTYHFTLTWNYETVGSIIFSHIKNNTNTM